MIAEESNRTGIEPVLFDSSSDYGQSKVYFTNPSMV